MKRLGILIAVLLWAAAAQAQTNPIGVGKAFDVSFTHDGSGGSGTLGGFRCYADDVKVGTDLAATARVCSFPAGLSVGTHTIKVGAFNQFLETPSSPLAVTAGSGPPPATNLQLVVKVAIDSAGNVTLLAASVTSEPATPQ